MDSGTTKNKGANKKKKLSEQDIEDIWKLREKGLTITELAKRYGVSRQTLSKAMNAPPEEGYTMRMIYCFRQFPCTIIDINFRDGKIKIRNTTPNILRRAFGVVENPTREDFEIFLQDRCFPPNRGMMKSVLAGLSIDSYDTLQIVEKTNGRTAEDHMWIQCKYFPTGKD